MMSPNELENMTTSCLSRIENHTEQLAKHDAMIKAVKEQAEDNSHKLSTLMWMLFLVIAEVPITIGVF